MLSACTSTPPARSAAAVGTRRSNPAILGQRRGQVSACHLGGIWGRVKGAEAFSAWHRFPTLPPACFLMVHLSQPAKSGLAGKWQVRMELVWQSPALQLAGAAGALPWPPWHCWLQRKQRERILGTSSPTCQNAGSEEGIPARMAQGLAG